MQRLNPEIGHEGPPYASYKGVFKGTIEQRVDPQRMGRLRVRVVGVHGPQVPTEHLPWAWPRVPAWQEGGIFWIPPIGETVWITFEKGEYEYPTWSGGWWASGQTAQGQKNSKHRDWPTTNFGGGAWGKNDILQLEKLDGVRGEDAPNNYTIISPRQKHLEFDDRKGKEKIKLADWQDNFLYLNSERGVITLEVVEGYQQAGQRKSRGLTLSSNVSEAEVIQLYTTGHWYVTIDDLKQVLDVNTPGRHRLVIDDAKDRIEIWVNDGHHLIIDQTERRIVVRTAQGRTLVLDDASKILGLWNPNEESYIYQDDDSKHMEVRSEGTMALKVLGDLNISSGGRVNIDGVAGVFLNSGYFDASNTLAAPLFAYQKPDDLTYEHPVSGTVTRKVPRAPDYPDQASPRASDRRGIPPTTSAPTDTI